MQSSSDLDKLSWIFIIFQCQFQFTNAFLIILLNFLVNFVYMMVSILKFRRGIECIACIWRGLWRSTHTNFVEENIYLVESGRLIPTSGSDIKVLRQFSNLYVCVGLNGYCGWDRQGIFQFAFYHSCLFVLSFHLVVGSSYLSGQSTSIILIWTDVLRVIPLTVKYVPKQKSKFLHVMIYRSTPKY